MDSTRTWNFFFVHWLTSPRCRGTVAENTIYVGAEIAGVYRSTDGGEVLESGQV